ncbi:kinase D-interacting substrate of 220 kDa isoform X1 [Lingula anatina]|uniref:Kinase D-interacting substrate of 220 kDa isoform X1 n=2 Tax=Lingula anatina TaxID=7574 RepID=A0A1S3IUJ2_LINAN|nr:kinase D-interacting substrate of 220 kDa isoform X1 [Lingula anatina]|eukprot:XP_013401875.1 kinase D-interacting substrate of 220 kDa isoform X1 [Lingula anatina]
MSAVIVNAASKGDLELLTKALRGKFGEVTKENVNEGLMRAANMGNFKCVEYLLSAGGDPNALDMDGDSPLKLAINNNYGRIGKLLIEKGGDVNMLGSKGRVPIHASAYHGNFKVTELLVDKGAKVNIIDEYGDTPLTVAAARGHVAVVKLLIKTQRSRGQETPEAERNRDLNVAILRASATGKANCVRELLAAGANVNYRDGWYVTPLIHATQRNNPEVLKVLLKAGADITLTTSHQKDAFHYAVVKNYTECVKLLLEHGANPDGYDLYLEQGTAIFDTPKKQEQVPLMVAVTNNNAEVAKSLIQAGCHINKHMKQVDLLSSVIYVGNLRLAKILVCAGWSPNAIRVLFQEGVVGEACDELSIWCQDVISRPRPLLEIARTCIAECLYQHDYTRIARGKKVASYKNKTDQLPLPTPLKKYLQYSDLDHQ